MRGGAPRRTGWADHRRRPGQRQSIHRERGRPPVGVVMRRRELRPTAGGDQRAESHEQCGRLPESHGKKHCRRDRCRERCAGQRHRQVSRHEHAVAGDPRKCEQGDGMADPPRENQRECGCGNRGSLALLRRSRPDPRAEPCRHNQRESSKCARPIHVG